MDKLLLRSGDVKAIAKQIAKETSRQNNIPDDRPLNVSDVAEILKISSQAVKKRCQVGTLPGHKVGRRWVLFLSEINASFIGAYPKTK